MHGRLVDERKQANATAQALTTRLETLAGLLPGLRDLAERLGAVPSSGRPRPTRTRNASTTRTLPSSRPSAPSVPESPQSNNIASRHCAAQTSTATTPKNVASTCPMTPGTTLTPTNSPLSRWICCASRFADAERMWQSAVGDSALHTKTAMLKEQLDKLQADLKDFTTQELHRADALRGTPDAIEPERRRAATAQARGRRQDSEAEYAEAKTLLKQARDAERSVPAAPPRDDTNGVELDVGPLDYPDAATARLAYDQADGEANAARSAANSFDQLRSENLATAESARAEAATFRGSERVLAATVASLPAAETAEPGHVRCRRDL